MKKLFFALLAITSLTFVSCTENSNDDNTPTGYTLTIEPAEAKVGETITLTVVGEGATNYQLNVCDDISGNCYMPFSDGSASWTVTAGNAPFVVGEYSCHAQLTNKETGKVDHHTENVSLKVTE